MTGNGELKSILENMEHESMVKLVMELEERTGNGTVADMARDIAKEDLGKRMSPEAIHDRVSWAISMCDEDFYSQIGEGRYGYISPYDAAHDMIVAGIADEFLQDAKMLVEMGRDDDLELFIHSIADGLRDSYSILTEWSPDTTTELAENLVECLEDGCPLEGFDW